MKNLLLFTAIAVAGFAITKSVQAQIKSRTNASIGVNTGVNAEINNDQNSSDIMTESNMESEYEADMDADYDTDVYDETGRRTRSFDASNDLDADTRTTGTVNTR